MTEEFALFLGCVIPTRLPHVEKACRSVIDLLGIKLQEMVGAGCCPEPISSQSLSVDMWVTLAARNLCIGESLGKDILTLCAGCFETLKTTQTLLEEDDELKTRVNSRLKEIGMEYKGTSKVYHFVEIFSRPEYLEKIKALVKKPLDNISVSAHYGCHLLRPSRILQFDDPENPVSMDNILKAIGAKSINTPEKMSCCGQCVKLDPAVGKKLVTDKIVEYQNNDIDAVSVVCPGCFTQLDTIQRAVNKSKTESDPELKTPIIYLSELMALAMGIPKEELALKRRSIKPKEFIAKIS